MVAIVPLSKYSNGFTVSAVVRALITRPTYLPSCIAGCAMPGSLFNDTMSPMANTSGWPGKVQSGSTGTRPARSVSTPAARASIPARGEACTPAAQIRVRAGIVSVPSGPFTVMVSWSMSTAREFTRTSTPIFSSRLRV